MKKIIQFSSLFGGVYFGKTVLITGHTGFKGSWLKLWLKKMGAHVIGYSLEPPTTPNHWNLLELDTISIIEDIRKQNRLHDVLTQYQPEIVFHLAAQSLVRESYNDPVETFETNVLGSVKLFEACRHVDSVKAIINVTSDKCYENKEWPWGYREQEPMGGHDPYSASKGCAELVTACYQNSFFTASVETGIHIKLLASARAGNVIGGGDWANDRLIPDIMKAAAKEELVTIRNPSATRPWQHVLEPLSGYLLLGWRLLEGNPKFAEGWNFGPADDGFFSVLDLVKKVKESWEKVTYQVNENHRTLHEAHLLKLDCSKASSLLAWKGVWDTEKTIQKTVVWYRNYYRSDFVSSTDDLIEYIQDATAKNLIWAVTN
jgi:CDP-glucose 4,6-dehydratase